MNGEDLPTTEEFTYLDSAVRHNGGARNDIKAEKCLQNAQQRVEVLSIQHQDQAEDLPRLCYVLPTIRLWMLEDDRERNHQAFSLPHRTTEESCKSFGPIPSPTYSYSPAAIKTACWPLTCEGDGDGSDTSWGESRTTSLVQPFIRHLKESTRGDDRETADAELWRQRSRPCNTLGVPSRS